jgi:hypothetical protein
MSWMRAVERGARFIGKGVSVWDVTTFCWNKGVSDWVITFVIDNNAGYDQAGLPGN